MDVSWTWAGCLGTAKVRQINDGKDLILMFDSQGGIVSSTIAVPAKAARQIASAIIEIVGERKEG